MPNPIIVRMEAISACLKLPIVLTPEEIAMLTSLRAWDAYRKFRMINEDIVRFPGNHWQEHMHDYTWVFPFAGAEEQLRILGSTIRYPEITISAYWHYTTQKVGEYELCYSHRRGDDHKWTLTIPDQEHRMFITLLSDLNKELDGEIAQSLLQSSVLLEDLISGN